MITYSKLPYTCYEAGHTWHHSCAKASGDMLLSSAMHSLKLYAVVYLVTALVSKKKFSKEYAVRLLKDYFRSVCFLTLNGSTFVGSFCVMRRIIGHINFLTAGFMPGFTASLLAILIERKSRRSLLAVYVANVASECLWNVCRERGYVKPVPRGEVFLFAAAMIILGYYFKSSSSFSPMINSLFKMVLGEDESSLFGKNFKKRSTNESNRRVPSPCMHKGSCFIYITRSFLRSFLGGYLFNVGFKTLTVLPRLLQKPATIIDIATHSSTFQMALFVSSFTALFKIVCCTGRNISGREHPVHGAIAGGIAGLSMIFYSSPSLALYAVWKAIEAVYEHGQSAGYLPDIPGGIELFYAFAVGYLFHVAVVENFNMKSSYWKFLIDMTEGRMAEINRFLIEPYGLDSARYQIWPQYDPAHLTEEFKKQFADKLLSN